MNSITTLSSNQEQEQLPSPIGLHKPI